MKQTKKKDIDKTSQIDCCTLSSEININVKIKI